MQGTGYTRGMKPRTPFSYTHGPTESAIQRAAYHLWEEAGRPSGRDQEFWFAARERLRHRAPPARQLPTSALSRARNAQPAPPGVR